MTGESESSGAAKRLDFQEELQRRIQRRKNWALPHLLTVFAEKVCQP
jgi:hypothetical protein